MTQIKMNGSMLTPMEHPLQASSHRLYPHMKEHILIHAEDPLTCSHSAFPSLELLGIHIDLMSKIKRRNSIQAKMKCAPNSLNKDDTLTYLKIVKKNIYISTAYCQQNEAKIISHLR